MWEKILLAAAVTFSLHIFAGIDLSDIKLPFASLSSVTTAESQVPKVFSFPENFQVSNPTNINTLLNK